MTTLEYILDGFEAELALERELGVRIVEIDRALLLPLPANRAAPPAPQVQSPSRSAAPAAPPAPVAPVAPPAPTPQTPPAPHQLPPESIVFLHHRPLEGEASEMIHRIAKAMGVQCVVVCANPLPHSKVYIVLGGNARKLFFPASSAGPGNWISDLPDGASALVTYSPLHLLKFPPESHLLKKLKSEMWQSLKNAMARLHAAKK